MSGDEDRSIDRKANTEEQSETSGVDLRPDLDHFDGFTDGAKSLWARLPTLPLPSWSPVGVVMATLYAFVVVGALLVGYGATSLASAHGGVHAALIVGGTFVFGYGYVGLQILTTATVIEP